MRAALLALGIVLFVPCSAEAQTITSAANQLFHVNDASTLSSVITVADPAGGNIGANGNRGIYITIPGTLNMTWDTSVPTVTLTGNGAGNCSPTVTYVSNATVKITVNTAFTAGQQVIISGLQFTSFTAASGPSSLQLSIKSNLQLVATDSRTITIGPYYNVTITPASTTVNTLPTNGANITATFTLTNIGAVSDSFDLLTTKKPGTALTTVSISGTSITQGANPDSARRRVLASNGTVTVTLTYRVSNVAGVAVDTFNLTGRSINNPARTSTGVLVVNITKPAISIAKAVTPAGSPLPGTDITFKSTVTNIGNASASGMAIVDSIPTVVQFKLSSASTTLPAGVTAAIEYSNDGGLTWTYAPSSGACSAPAGYDRCVNRIRWRLLAALSSTAGSNQGTLQFVSQVR